jgi:hypothetical protein
VWRRRGAATRALLLLIDRGVAVPTQRIRAAKLPADRRTWQDREWEQIDRWIAAHTEVPLG